MEERYEDILKDTIKELKDILGEMEDNQKRDERIEELRTKLQENDEIENWNAFYQGEDILENDFNKEEGIEELKQLLEDKNNQEKEIVEIRNRLNEVVKTNQEEIERMDTRIEELRTKLQENHEIENFNSFYQEDTILENSFNKEEAVEELKQLLIDRDEMEKRTSNIGALANLVNIDSVYKIYHIINEYDRLFEEKTYSLNNVEHIEKIEVNDEDILSPGPVITMEDVEKEQEEAIKVSQGRVYLEGEVQKEEITVGEVKEIIKEEDIRQKLVERFDEIEAAVGFSKELLSKDYINLKEAFLDKGLVAEFGGIEERLKKLEGVTLLSIYEGQKELYMPGSKERKEVEELIEKVKAVMENKKVDKTEQKENFLEDIERVNVEEESETEEKQEEVMEEQEAEAEEEQEVVVEGQEESETEEKQEIVVEEQEAILSEQEKRRQEKLQQLYGIVIDMSRGYADILDKYAYFNKYYAKIYTNVSETSIENEIERLKGSNIMDSIKEMISEKQKHNDDGRLNDEIEELTNILKEIKERKNELEKKAKEELEKQTSTKNQDKENGKEQGDPTEKTIHSQQQPTKKVVQQEAPQIKTAKAEFSTGLGINNISIGKEIIITYSDNSRSMISFGKMKKDVFIKPTEKIEKINKMYGHTFLWVNRGLVLDRVDPMLIDALMVAKEKGVSSEKINSIFRTYVQAIEYGDEEAKEATKTILTYDKRGLLGIIGNVFRGKEYKKLAYNANKAEEFAEIIEDDKADKSRDRLDKKKESQEEKEKAKEEKKVAKLDKKRKKEAAKKEKLRAKEEKKLFGKKKQKALPIYEEQDDWEYDDNWEYDESAESYPEENTAKKAVCERASDEVMEKLMQIGERYKNSEGKHKDNHDREKEIVD